MVLLWNKKMMSPFVEPDNGGSNEPSEPDIKPEDELYELPEIEMAIASDLAHISSSDNSLTINIRNLFDDFDFQNGRVRINSKESKGAENLANGKPRYYPSAYTEATKEQIVQPEPDEPAVPGNPGNDSVS